jgi:hypothetical protein
LSAPTVGIPSGNLSLIFFTREEIDLLFLSHITRRSIPIMNPRKVITRKIVKILSERTAVNSEVRNETAADKRKIAKFK